MIKHCQYLITALPATLLSIALPIYLQASDKTEMSTADVIEQRQSIMKSYKSWDKELSNMFKSGEIDSEKLKEAASFFQNNSGETLLTLYPNAETPEGVKTKAKTAIWRSWDEFSTITNATNKAASEVLAFIEQDKLDDAVKAMNPIINSCRSCHRKYKAR